MLVRQLCQAMEFVHRNNIIHLDLKPENILCLTREGNRIKIIDFGLARRYDPDKKLQVIYFIHCYCRCPTSFFWFYSHLEIEMIGITLIADHQRYWVRSFHSQANYDYLLDESIW